MSHHVRMERVGSYLHVTVTGDNTPLDVAEYLSEVGAACLSHKCGRVLIEENLTGESLPASTIFSIVERGSKNARTHPEAMAYVDTNEEHDHSGMHFAGSVAAKKGLNIRIFRKVAEARKWLDGLAD